MRDDVVDVDGLTVRFGRFTAVDNVSFRVGRGEIFGFLGANGAGKTTTIRVLCGLLVPASGRIRVAGLGFENGGKAIKRKVGYMSQQFTLYNDLTVDENLSFIASLHRMGTADFRRRESELFEFVGRRITGKAFVGDLPGGEKQEVALVAALLHSPEIVFLDEPTAGVSPAARRRFWDLIRSLSRDGVTVFVTTHYMDEAEQCDRIALMRSGRIIALDSPSGLKTSTFPETMVEVDLGPHGRAHAATLAASGAVTHVRPSGMRFHALLSDESRLNSVASSIPGAGWRRIVPSLEDVFVRLVEGDDR